MAASNHDFFFFLIQNLKALFYVSHHTYHTVRVASSIINHTYTLLSCYSVSVIIGFSDFHNVSQTFFVWHILVLPRSDLKSPGWLVGLQEQVLPRLIRGQVHRCVGNYDRSRDVLTCVSVRPGLPSELQNAQEAVKVCDAEMRALIKSFSEVWQQLFHHS